MTAAQTTSHPAALSAARQALSKAEAQAKPLDPDTRARALLLPNGPERVALMDAWEAEARATIPGLLAAYQALTARSCHRCLGTGEHAGASRYTRHGVKWCWTCGGTGLRKSARS